MTRVDQAKALALSMRKMIHKDQDKLFVHGPSTVETIDAKRLLKVVTTHRDPDYTTIDQYDRKGELISHNDSRGDFK